MEDMKELKKTVFGCMCVLGTLTVCNAFILLCVILTMIFGGN